MEESRTVQAAEGPEVAACRQLTEGRGLEVAGDREARTNSHRAPCTREDFELGSRCHSGGLSGFN